MAVTIEKVNGVTTYQNGNIYQSFVEGADVNTQDNISLTIQGNNKPGGYNFRFADLDTASKHGQSDCLGLLEYWNNNGFFSAVNASNTSSVTGQPKINISSPLSAFGDLRTIDITPQFQLSFEYTVDNTELTSYEVVNTGTVTQADAMAVIGSGTTTGSTAHFDSKRRAKYRAGLGGLLRFTALFTSPVAGTEQYIGLTDEEGSSATFKNGLTIGYDGTTFGFQRWANDGLTTAAQSTWDDPLDGTGRSGETLDQTKLNVFYINFQYLGAGAQFLYWEKADGEVIPVHTFSYANQNTVPSSYNPNYHFTTFVNNGATTSDIILKTASVAYFIEGKTRYFEVHQPQFSTGKKTKSTVTTEVAIFTVRNKSSYASKTNFIDVVLENVGVNIETNSANNLGEARLVRDATLGGVPSYADINTTDSVMEIDVAGTTVAGGKELFLIPLAGKNDGDLSDLSNYDIILAPGESVTLAANSVNSATLNGNLLWKELF